jgi:hypothetical protein
VNSSSECERVRIALMAALDGENDRASTPEPHLATCTSCQQWLQDLQGVVAKLDGLTYPNPRRDLWMAVEAGIARSERRAADARTLWPIVAIVLGWRTLQLAVDLPLPLLHTVVPLAALVAAVWLIAGDPLAIETSAPELQKGGVS